MEVSPVFSHKFRFAAFGSLVAAMFLGAVDARATSMVPFNHEDLSHIADAIVVADVLKVDTEARFVPSANRLAKQITTLTTVKVVDSWKGAHAAGEALTLREIGGVVEKEMVAVPGTAGFLKGERVLLFLHYRTTSNEYGLVGWTQGKFTLLANANGGWDVAKIRLDVPEWGTSFVPAEHENRAIRDTDLATMAAKVKRIVKADAAAQVNWRDMPQYRGISGKGIQQ